MTVFCTAPTNKTTEIYRKYNNFHNKLKLRFKKKETTN